MLAEVLAHLRSKGARWTLRVCGEGPQRGALEQRIREYGLDDAVHFEGYVEHGDRLLHHYRHADALVVPSRSEGVPQTIIEALALGLPVVCSDVGGTRATFGESVALVRPGDAGAIAECLYPPRARSRGAAAHGRRGPRHRRPPHDGGRGGKARRVSQSRGGMTPPRPLGRSIADAFAAQAVSATFTLVTAVVTMRVLGPHEYGVLAIVFGFATVAALLCDLGLSMAAARFAAERFESPGAVARVARDALAVKVVLAVIVATAIVALSDPIARALGAGGGVWALRLMAAAAGAQAIFASAIGTLNAVRRTRVSLAAVCAESVVESLGTGVAVLLAGTAAAAAAGRLTGYTAGALVSVVLMARALGLRRPGPRVVTTRALLGYAGAIAVVEGAFVVFTRIDSVLLGPLAGPTAAGQFDAVVRIATLLQYPGLAVAIALAPRFAGRVAAGDRALLGRTLGRLLLLQAALVIPVAVWFGSAAQLGLGGGYAACGVIALAMSPYLLLWGLAPILTMTASYAGLARRRVGAALVTVTVNVVLDLATDPAIRCRRGRDRDRRRFRRLRRHPRAPLPDDRPRAAERAPGGSLRRRDRGRRGRGLGCEHAAGSARAPAVGRGDAVRRPRVWTGRPPGHHCVDRPRAPCREGAVM